jgi:putative oxidoreductase
MLTPNTIIQNILVKYNLNIIIDLIARILIAYIFILSGFGKITDYQGTLQYMESMGVPGSLLPLTIFVEFGGGLAILLGIQTRFAAFGLAIFSILTALIFHSSGGDQIDFLKNIAIAGGFLLLTIHGANKLSLDHFFSTIKK